MAELSELQTWLAEILRYFRHPGIWLEIAVLALALLFAALVRRIVLRPAAGRERPVSFGRGGIERIAFPLLALALVAAGRAMLARWGVSTGLLKLAVPLLGSAAIVGATVFALRHAFAPSGRLLRFERAAAIAVWVVVALHILGWLDPLAEGLDSVGFDLAGSRISPWMILRAAVSVLATVLFALWIGGLVEDRLMRAEALETNVRLLLSRVSKSLLVLAAVLVGLPLVGIDITTLSVFGGALGVGLGFGMQKIASNYVSGFIILLDRSISPGNLIEVDRYSGEVTQITTRYTVLRSLTGIESIVPNELLVSSVVTNQTYTNPHVRVALRVQVGYAGDVERAMALMAQAARGEPRVLAEPAPEAYLVSFDDSGITLELGCWIADPQRGTLAVRSAINLAILRAFRAEGIEIPFPQRVLHIAPGAAAPGAP
ncbi:MAG: hypothetical protein OHK0026_02020 [Rhodocyclaceae bacterium]